ncbi:uncharacterized protein [Phaseolus vulgaris]
MYEFNVFFAEGSAVNRPPMFNGLNYAFWKVRMRIFMESIDALIWEAVVNGPYVPMQIVKDEQVEKPRSEWNDTERRKAQHDLVAKNIITSALTMDEFFRISQCKSAKEMWEVLEVTHEGTEDVKRSRKHALIQEYELFRMQPGENIADILKCLDRSWQPKVTAISESRDLSKLGTTVLFGKLMEHELELKRLKEQETTERKPKGLALKASELDENKEEKEDAEDDDTINLLTKRFSKFLRKKSKNRNLQKKSKKFERNKGRRAYISWEENEASSTSSSSTEDEENNLCFMMKDEESSSESQVESCISRVEQSPTDSMQNALSPSLKALIADQLLRHSDKDVKVVVASCFSEITRITAPEAPYDDDQMKEVFQLIVSSFENSKKIISLLLLSGGGASSVFSNG